MSILARLPVGVAHQIEIGISPEVVLVLLTAASIGVAVAARVFPPRKLEGRERIPAGRPVGPLVAVFFGGMGIYFFVISGIAALMNRGQSVTTKPATQPVESMAEVALLATLPALVSLGALLYGDRLIRPTVQQDLGNQARRLPKGVLRGLLGAFIVVPPLYLLSQAMEMAYRAVHYQHPTEHPLLKALSERPSGAVTFAIIVGACVLAPLFEELLFRGHIQTLLKRLVRNSWAAIVLTSIAFSLVHPVWSWPIIFVLALCLGYAYERTGNLWVNITMHAVFNTVSTVLFLVGLYSH